MEVGAIACLSFAVFLLVFAIRRRIKVRVIQEQTQAAVVQNPAKLRKKFHCIAYYLFVAGIASIVVWLLPLWYSKPLFGYWLTGGIAFWAVAVDLIVQGNELTTKNQEEFGQKEYGQKILGVSNRLIYIALILIIAGIFLQIWAFYQSLHS